MYLKKFSCDHRENIAPATCSMVIVGWVVITRHLTAVVEASADLADGERVRQLDRLFGQNHPGRVRVRRAEERRVDLAEIALGPRRALEILVPCDDGKTATSETAEHRRAPPLAVEDEGERWRAGVGHRQVGRVFGQHAERFELRHDVVFECLDHLRIKGLCTHSSGLPPRALIQ